MTLLDMLSWKRVIGCALLGGFCASGDAILQFPWISKNMVLRAMVDNGTHAVVGLWCWSLIGGLQRTESVLQAILCGVLSSLVDLDHFFAARSWDLKDALSLKSRPPFHATTIIPVIACILKLADYFHPIAHLRPLHWIFTVAWLSHHIRDGTRRGLWLWPMGSTSPLPYWLYLLATMMLPLVTMGILELTNGKKSQVFAPIPQLV